MKNIRLFIKEKQNIIVIVLICAFVLIAIHVINWLIKNNNQKQDNSINSNIIIDETKQLKSSIGVSDGISTDEKNIYKDYITVFLDYCNNGDIEKAYNMLSDECKEIVFYNDINKFKNNYIDKIFNSKKNYTIQNWVNSTFKVGIKEDMLSTGKTDGSETQDYITVVGNGKLNVLNFIKSESINKNTTMEKIKISVLKRYVFMDYETYDVKVENNCGENILLDDLSNTKNMYLVDKKDVKYYSASNNLNQVLLTVNSGEVKTINIRFINPYISSRVIKNMVFRNIYMLNSNKKMEISVAI